jgi:hypothetical protein
MCKEMPVISWLTRWWTKKNNRKKWRAEEEERHKGSLAQKKLEVGFKWLLFQGPMHIFSIH